MSPPIPSPHPVLYVWPGRWNLPSSHPECLAAIIYLQLAIPGQFALAECVNPDLSPSGTLFWLGRLIPLSKASKTTRSASVYGTWTFSLNYALVHHQTRRW